MPGRFLKSALLCPILLLASLAPAWAEVGSEPFVPAVWTILPFAGILFTIALFPLLAPHFWEHHFGKISAGWLLLSIALMYLSVPAGTGFAEAYGSKFFDTYEEYVAFIILLGSLFIISGGIYISGNLPGKPGINTAMLASGALLASLVGTTGAAMLLIRPLLRANESRRRKVHVVLFFIFLVCNIGGALTPIGDPPLFLGYLQGVPFEWTLNLVPEWGFTCGTLLLLFYAIDRYLYRQDVVAGGDAGPLSIRIEGRINIVLLLGVIGAVILSGLLHFETAIPVFGLGHLLLQNLLRDGLQVLLAATSLLLTPKAVRASNRFTYGPIKEVAYLFIGIFTTMIPALMLLNVRGGELGLKTAAQYFWATGTLSSFLDNAPTYLTFLATAMGSLGLSDAHQMTLTPASESILAGISLGAVFMGAMTYIGNGPNFMVKAIAEGQGVRMPSFFGYMVYSLIILFPLFCLLVLLFL